MGLCDVPVISTVCETAGEAAASLVSAPFDWLAQAMGGAAGWLFEAVWSVFDTTTLVDVQRLGFVSVFNLVFGIAVFVMLLFFALQLITGMIRRDPTALTRAALGLGKSVLGSFVVITLVAPDRMHKPLTATRDWLQHHRVMVSAGILLTIGVLLIGDGIYRLIT